MTSSSLCHNYDSTLRPFPMSSPPQQHSLIAWTSTRQSLSFYHHMLNLLWYHLLQMEFAHRDAKWKYINIERKLHSKATNIHKTIHTPHGFYNFIVLLRMNSYILKFPQSHALELHASSASIVPRIENSHSCSCPLCACFLMPLCLPTYLMPLCFFLLPLPFIILRSYILKKCWRNTKSLNHSTTNDW